MEKMSVYEALSHVISDMGGIRKEIDKGSTIKYPYRRIDAICGESQPLFGKYGICTVPNVLSKESKEIVRNGNPWIWYIVIVKWDIFGCDGSKIESITYGESLDNSDKGINKAMTSSYKNLLLRLLCIGDPQDDPDSHDSHDYHDIKNYSTQNYDNFQLIPSELEKEQIAAIEENGLNSPLINISQGILSMINEKSGINKNGKPYIKYGVTIIENNGVKNVYGTFSETLKNKVESNIGMECQFEWKQDGKYKTLIDFSLIDK